LKYNNQIIVFGIDRFGKIGVGNSEDAVVYPTILEIFNVLFYFL